ncbi:MAG: TIGR03936 family radical SAM-associated protein [Candidatus Omnitrophota bacterium]
MYQWMRTMFFKYTFRFSKEGDMIYISHLDLMRLLTRAARRADLPVCLTQGFNPRLKISLKRALKLGVASDNEEGEIVLAEKIEDNELLGKLCAVMPKGIEVQRINLAEEKK